MEIKHVIAKQAVIVLLRNDNFYSEYSSPWTVPNGTV